MMPKRIITAIETKSPLPCAYNEECKQAGCKSCRSWTDVEKSLLKMDSIYGASFTSWLKNEENVMVTATYLQRVCNEYCFPRILSAIKWLESGWKADSTAWLLRHLTMHWGTGNRCSTDKVDMARATFVQCLMENWSKFKKADFVPSFLDLAYPNHHNSSNARRLMFLKTLFDKVDFKSLSEIFSLMGNGLDYTTKVILLQEAARRDSFKLSINKRRNDLMSLKDLDSIEPIKRICKGSDHSNDKTFSSNEGNTINANHQFNALGLVFSNNSSGTTSNNTVNSNDDDLSNNLEQMFETTTYSRRSSLSLRSQLLNRTLTDDNITSTSSASSSTLALNSIDENSSCGDERARTCPGSPNNANLEVRQMFEDMEESEDFDLGTTKNTSTSINQLDGLSIN